LKETSGRRYESSRIRTLEELQGEQFKIHEGKSVKQFWTMISRRTCGKDLCISEEEPFEIKFKERIPKELGVEAILVIHRKRMRGKRSMLL
jgi:hypothetical protein